MFIGEKFNMSEVAKKFNLNNFIRFDFRIPYELSIPIGIYQVIIENNLSEEKVLLNKKRKIIYLVTERLIENQHLSNKTFCEYDILSDTYKVFVTDIEVMLETFDDEDDAITRCFNLNKNIFSEIAQNIAYIGAIKYNESNNGRDYLQPYIENFGRQVVCYYNFNEHNLEYESKNVVIAAGYHRNHSDYVEFKKDYSNSFSIWKYYYNKSKYAFSVYDNIECILSATISIESYVEEILNQNNVRDELYKDKTSDNLSFYQITNFLHKKGIFSKEEKENANKYFSKVKVLRNDIVHGRLLSPVKIRKHAIESIESISEFYSLFEKDNIQINP